jgi:hypothetical protein
LLVCLQKLYLTVTDMFKYLLCYVQLGVGENVENQRKAREKSKAAENQAFWFDFYTIKKTVHTPSGSGKNQSGSTTLPTTLISERNLTVQ